MNDESIIQLYFDRDESALDKSMEKYGGLCNDIAYSILKNREDSEECVNSAFMKVWQSIPPKKPNNLSAFCVKITRNLALDKYRRSTANKRNVSQCDIALEELGECVGISDVEEAFDETNAIDAINSFLGMLSPQNRRVFMRRYFYFDSIKDIAGKYSLSTSNVKIILKRTRDKLKEYLKKEGVKI